MHIPTHDEIVAATEAAEKASIREAFRDKFAMAALIGMIAEPFIPNGTNVVKGVLSNMGRDLSGDAAFDLSTASYHIADAMLVARDAK